MHGADQGMTQPEAMKTTAHVGGVHSLPDDEPWATPLAWARKLELTEIEEILLKHGVTR
jgi:hypothetical protein